MLSRPKCSFSSEEGFLSFKVTLHIRFWESKLSTLENSWKTRGILLSSVSEHNVVKKTAKVVWDVPHREKEDPVNQIPSLKVKGKGLNGH